MFLKPDYNLKNVYDINFEELKQQGIVKQYSEYKKARKIEGFTVRVMPRKFVQDNGENEAQIPTSKAQIPTSKA